MKNRRADSDVSNPSSGSVTDLEPDKEGFGLVIPGKSLAHALLPDNELQFLELAKRCKAVICCRVTPLQKGEPLWFGLFNLYTGWPITDAPKIHIFKTCVHSNLS